MKSTATKLELDKDSVYCLVHGCIHEPNPNLYRESEGEEKCGPSDWKDVWVGDWFNKPMKKPNH